MNNDDYRSDDEVFYYDNDADFADDGMLKMILIIFMMFMMMWIALMILVIMIIILLTMLVVLMFSMCFGEYIHLIRITHGMPLSSPYLLLFIIN